MSAITKNLPAIIREPAVALIGKECYVSLVENLNVSDVECLKYAVSKGLGIAIVVGGSVIKIPQVLLVVRSRSARGLSFAAYVLETISYAISLFYSARNQFPFSTYGENLFLTLQNLVITFLIVLYQSPSSSHQSLSTRQPKKPTGVLFAAAAAAVAIVLTFVPARILSILQLLTLPLGLISKFPQITQNARAQSTGQLSGIAVSAQILGCLARLFTTATEVGDSLLTASFALALLLNIVIGGQMLAYQGNEEVKETTMDLSEKRAEAPHVYSPTPVAASAPMSVPSSPTPRSGTPQGGRKWARKVD
ncbi:hypothetical protein BOTBODRAFT_101106 [Botryobasidium botryosum FD-172 SS1]|uniref:Mannose-P-dolichol utilization defect 1 protein homolog n=1 Tax=Botryobasidium botryosum (strain FD-172 SS1) TaxID=930990 RepID=A0A067MZC9_BOTB1|nr:hypothetical protein BOTBODRAFT_101106 [Botryobasidium botryosum FD-172 SS1]